MRLLKAAIEWSGKNVTGFTSCADDLYLLCVRGDFCFDMRATVNTQHNLNEMYHDCNSYQSSLLLSATHLPSHRLSCENMVIYAQYRKSAELRIYFRQHFWINGLFFRQQ